MDWQTVMVPAGVVAAALAAGFGVSESLVRMDRAGIRRALRRRAASVHDEFLGGSGPAAGRPMSGRLGSNRLVRRVVARVDEAETGLSLCEIVVRGTAAAAGLGAISLLVSGSALGFVISAVVVCAFAWSWIGRKAARRIERMRELLPAAFGLLASSLSSGLSLLQAIEYAARETPEPLAREWRLVIDDVGAGMALTEAMERLRTRVPLRELDSLVIALELQYRTGGNLCDLLQRAAASLRSAGELRRSLRVQTSQARFSAKMVGLLPLGLLAVLSLFSGEYISGFFSSTAGIVMFLVALAMEGLGYVLVQAVSRVEV